jgi:two-component system, LytTR family, sensor kinase
MRNDRKRFIYMILLGILITLVLNIFIPDKNWKIIHFYDFLVSIFITIIVWEGNLRIDHWLNQKYPWITSPAKRIIIHLVLSVGYSAISIFLAAFLFNCFSNELSFSGKDFVRVTLIILGVLVLMSILLLTIEISTQFFRHWKNSLVEIEKYRAESLQAQLQNLKNQINPHFLFNNLSVLSSLVYKDQDKAVEFINQLSKVYRYLLDNQNSELVTVEQELLFLRSYIFLLHIRFDNSLIIKTDIKKEDQLRLIPPIALQILIENAIKHNETSSEFPLLISILSKDEKLIVENDLRLRSQHEPGSQTGLQNIRDRYKFFTPNTVEVIQNTKSFIVKIPLLSSK